MTKLVIVQARGSSKRLPGKVLTKVEGKPLLMYLLERLRLCQAASKVVVATSEEGSDDGVAECGAACGVAVHRGSLDNVLERLLGAACREGEDAFVRVSGDSPLIDPKIVDRGIAEFETLSVDLVTNVFPRSYPKGQSVEVISVAALVEIDRRTSDAQDREHVTRFFYQNPSVFRVHNFVNDRNDSDLQMSVDTPADLDAFRAIVARMQRPHTEYGLADLLALHGRGKADSAAGRAA